VQAQSDWSRAYYNNVRPHRALGRRLRRDRLDRARKVTLRHGGRLHHISVGRA
jgi:transposase InsO family protein